MRPKTANAHRTGAKAGLIPLFLGVIYPSFKKSGIRVPGALLAIYPFKVHAVRRERKDGRRQSRRAFAHLPEIIGVTFGRLRFSGKPQPDKRISGVDGLLRYHRHRRFFGIAGDHKNVGLYARRSQEIAETFPGIGGIRPPFGYLTEADARLTLGRLNH